MMVMKMIMMIVIIESGNNLASNDLATWIGDGELPGGRHLVKYFKDDDADDEHEENDNDDDGDADDNDADDADLVKYEDDE